MLARFLGVGSSRAFTPKIPTARYSEFRSADLSDNVGRAVSSFSREPLKKVTQPLSVSQQSAHLELFNHVKSITAPNYTLQFLDIYRMVTSISKGVDPFAVITDSTNQRLGAVVDILCPNLSKFDNRNHTYQPFHINSWDINNLVKIIFDAIQEYDAAKTLAAIGNIDQYKKAIIEDALFEVMRLRKNLNAENKKEIISSELITKNLLAILRVEKIAAAFTLTGKKFQVAPEKTIYKVAIEVENCFFSPGLFFSTVVSCNELISHKLWASQNYFKIHSARVDDAKEILENSCASGINRSVIPSGPICELDKRGEIINYEKGIGEEFDWDVAPGEWNGG
jgi:hypothetical protein